MNNEDGLIKTINKAAHGQAYDIQRRIERAIIDVLNPFYRPKETGNEYIGDTIKQVLIWYASGIGKNDRPSIPPPSQELVDLCRQKILRTLLDGIPAFERILALSKETPDDEST